MGINDYFENVAYTADEAVLQKAKWITYPRACENTLLFEKRFCAKNILSARLRDCTRSIRRYAERESTAKIRKGNEFPFGYGDCRYAYRLGISNAKRYGRYRL